MVEFLLEQGANIDAIDSDLWTAMHYACARGHLALINLLKAQDTFKFYQLVQMKTNTSATCLHLAVQHGNRQSVEYILSQFHDDQRKTLINAQAEPFGTPLHIAGQQNDMFMSILLIVHDHFIRCRVSFDMYTSIERTLTYAQRFSNIYSLV
jgi:ankyrin repeat protein